MNCPICNVTLLLAENQGVDIDYCQQCRDNWFKKNNLKKTIDKKSSSCSPDNRGYISDSHLYEKHDKHHYQEGHRRKKVMFNFFD